VILSNNREIDWGGVFMNYEKDLKITYKYNNLILILFLCLLSCTSTATQLSSLKANYNKGKWGYVLGRVDDAKDAYSADEVILAAGDDTLTVNQAKLIKARALMHMFIQDRLAAGADATQDPDVEQALIIIKELSNEDFNLNWMNVELMASIADYFYLIDNYPAAFDAYDYLLNYADFESLDASHRQYIRRWVEMKRQLSGGIIPNPAYNEYTNQKFKNTYGVVLQKFPDDISVIKTGIIILAEEGKTRSAIQRAMLARFTAAKNPKTQMLYLKEIDELAYSIIDSLDKGDPEKVRLKLEYERFTEEWDSAVVSPTT
jgi:hypothetical protein